MHQVLEQTLKPVSKPKIQFLREIKFKLSADEENAETNPTEEREHDAVTDLPQSMQRPLKQIYGTKMAKALPTSGLVAHSMSDSRDEEKCSDA